MNGPARSRRCGALSIHSSSRVREFLCRCRNKNKHKKPIDGNWEIASPCFRCTRKSIACCVQLRGEKIGKDRREGGRPEGGTDARKKKVRWNRPPKSICHDRVGHRLSFYHIYQIEIYIYLCASIFKRLFGSLGTCRRLDMNRIRRREQK